MVEKIIGNVLTTTRPDRTVTLKPRKGEAAVISFHTAGASQRGSKPFIIDNQVTLGLTNIGDAPVSLMVTPAKLEPADTPPQEGLFLDVESRLVGLELTGETVTEPLTF